MLPRVVPPVGGVRWVRIGLYLENGDEFACLPSAHAFCRTVLFSDFSILFEPLPTGRASVAICSAGKEFCLR